MFMNDSIGTPILSVNRYTDLMPADNIGMSIGSRIKEARKAAKLTQKELATKVGMAQASLSELETGESQSTTLVASLAAALGVSALWLETGKGQMGEGSATNHAVKDVLELIPGAMRVRAAGPDDPDMVQIMKVRLKVQAGITGFQVEPENYDGETQGVPRKWVLREGLSQDALLSIVVKGESMEPALYEGDVIVVNTRDKHLVDGAVYVVNYEGEAVVKRMIRDAGQWWLSSDNADQRKYHRKQCKGAECIVIGRVVRKESTHI
jgi:phage repressor protein C with HTH and peptisase S24 domain